MNDAIAYTDRPEITNARILLSLMLLAAAFLFGDAVVGMRGIDVGTDTHNYANFFMMVRSGVFSTRFEPGFVLVTRALAAAGVSVVTYQSVLFLLFLGTVLVSTRAYYKYLGSTHGYLTFLVAALMFLYLSPVTVNATINAVRQGLASLLVFAALLSFYQRQWRNFVLLGVLATSFHYSSLLYMLFAPALLLSERKLRVLAVLAFAAYCSGLTMILIRSALPGLYVTVMAYDANANYRSGVRVDFAVFSIFWYLLPFLASRLVREPFRELINRSTAVYLVLLMPFFLVGWGNYSNRYLLPAWMSVSLVLAAIACNGRTTFLRNPLLLRGGLVVACGIFYYFVKNLVVV